MLNVSHKNETLRTAVAEALLLASADTIERIRKGQIPKGDVPTAARMAGIQAAKRTHELIPDCHPLALDWLEVEVAIEESGLRFTATAQAVARTGVEMEALTGAMVAALTAYDLLKPVDQELEISSVRLIEKRGGRSEFTERVLRPLRAAILVISDSAAAGKRKDRAGKAIAERLASEPVDVVAMELLPDETTSIASTLRRLADEEGLDLILTTGGTGLGPRDVTAEATREVIDREVPGIAEAMRDYGQRRTPYAMLSRGVAGVRGRTLIVNLPGSTRGATESIQALLPGLIHAFPMLQGGGHPE